MIICCPIALIKMLFCWSTFLLFRKFFHREKMLMQSISSSVAFAPSGASTIIEFRPSAMGSTPCYSFKWWSVPGSIKESMTWCLRMLFWWSMRGYFLPSVENGWLLCMPTIYSICDLLPSCVPNAIFKCQNFQLFLAFLNTQDF